MRLIIALAAAMAWFTGAAWACPDYSMSGATYHLTGAQLYTEQRYSVRAGGSINIQNCRNVNPQTDRGRGYVTQPPDFTFNLSGMGAYSLVISTVSDCDSILLINTGTATWYYDDDDNPSSVLDARINLTRPTNGWLDVWVGTHDGQYCDAVLSMETFYR